MLCVCSMFVLVTTGNRCGFGGEVLAEGAAEPRWAQKGVSAGLRVKRREGLGVSQCLIRMICAVGTCISPSRAHGAQFTPMYKSMLLFLVPNTHTVMVWLHLLSCSGCCLPADLRGAQKLHSAACLAGMAIFAVEDASVPHVPLVHATWHCLSALSTSLVNNVLADVEQQYPQLTLDALTLPEDSKQQQKQQQRGAIAPAGPL